MAENSAIELEALSYTLTSAEMQVLQSEPLCLAVHIAPYTGEGASQQFVQATISLQTSKDYPEVPAEVRLDATKGLGDAAKAALLQRLQAEATSLAGEMSLGHVCETAKEVLTDMNQPEGDCTICLEPLVLKAAQHANGGSHQGERIQRLPCYHCFHYGCFVRWWAADQRDHRKQREELLAERGHAVDSVMLDRLGLVTDSHGLFTVLCPACRSPVVPGSFGSELRQLVQDAKSSQQELNDHTVRLEEDEMQRLRLTQQRNNALLSRQKRLGGLVADSYAIFTGPLHGSVEN